MKSKIHTIRITQYAIRTFRQVNNKKGCLFNEKTMKNTTIFMQNKANLSEDKFGAKRFSTMIYERFHPLAGIKNKPNQTQFKPNTNPIPERLKMNLRNALKMTYGRFMPLAGQKNKPKTKPKQTQFYFFLVAKRPKVALYSENTDT